MRYAPPSGRSCLVLASLCLAVAACGSDDPPPTPAPTPTTSTLQVRPAGEGALEAGQSRQYNAIATLSTGTTSDVTQQAAWQSSAPAVATVSGTGMVTAVAEGTADISATYQSVRGTAGVGVRPVPCPVSLSPASATFGPFGGSAAVQVLVGAASCRWTARSDASWFPFAFDSGTPGSGTFAYTAPANSTTAPRTANIVITTSTGDTTVHTVTVNRTSGCSYVTDPEENVFTAAGGTGQFRVVTTPNDCRWNLVNGMAALGVQINQGFSGTGGGLVRYTVQANTRDVDSDGYLEIAGLSGDNPNGRHHIVIKKR